VILKSKKMKKGLVIIVFAVMSFVVNQAFAQKSSDCKFDVDKTDATSGKPVKKIKTKLTGSDDFFFVITRNDTAYSIILNLWISGAIKDFISKGEIVTIKMSGGTVLKLKNSVTAKPIPHYSDQTWTEYAPEYPIRSADLASLKSEIPINLKLKLGDDEVTHDFTTKDLEKIRAIIRCIMK
jgi:hypothetical protein